MESLDWLLQTCLDLHARDLVGGATRHEDKSDLLVFPVGGQQQQVLMLAVSARPASDFRSGVG